MRLMPRIFVLILMFFAPAVLPMRAQSMFPMRPDDLFLAKITIGCRIKYINRVSNSALSHVKLALCSAH
jgi:hypothetical protein